MLVSNSYPRIPMKRLPLYILLTSSLFLTSCEKDLNQRPSGSLNSEESVTTLSDLTKAVRGVYSRLNTRYGYSGEIALYGDGHGGDAKIVIASYNHSTSIHRFLSEKTSDISSGAYAAFSIVSGRVNDILQYIDVVEKATPAGEKTAVSNQVSQLYALRGLAHLELARIFSYLPTTGVNPDAAYSGIPLNNEVRPVGYAYQRSTLRETYAQIISDLTKSLEGLSKEKTLNSGYVNYWAAEALLARAYLYLGDWQNAYKYASDVITSSPYKLYTVEDYTKVWGQQGTSESLFEVVTTEKDNAGLNSLGGYTNPGNYPEFGAADDFVKWVQSTRSDDVRAKLIVERSKPDGGAKAYYTTKYLGQAGASNPTAMNNFKVIRLSELYLIASEALLKGATSSDGKKAVDYYNELRKNRFSNYTPATEVTLDNILDERRIEFFCEGHRFFDLVRNKRDLTTPYVAGGNGKVEYLDWRTVTELPEREKNINKDLVVRAAK